ncbi:UNVERIFIED_CONTAM: hypothetical protein Sradi_5280200 [Sesamum radiatum]|uniref:Retrotransposon gag domain-containing protein n=1 Tax=Sesamum radiatum TaxID=300843 RepID=A0AAW2LP62_SESRA
MTRSRSGELAQFDPKIERSFHRQRSTIERGDTIENSDTEEHLAIIEPTMDHVGAVERPMMEYSFPTADGTISSIALLTLQANNFEINPPISRSSGQLDKESLHDAWERFKGMLRRCPHLELPVWQQVQTFYNDVTLANRATIDAAAGGTIMKKLPSEAFNIIDEIATNLYSYRIERIDKRVANSIDAITTLSAQMVALTHKVDDLGVVIWNGAPIGSCGACGQIGY